MYFVYDLYCLYLFHPKGSALSKLMSRFKRKKEKKTEKEKGDDKEVGKDSTETDNHPEGVVQCGKW